jgi:hypothetical protein
MEFSILCPCLHMVMAVLLLLLLLLLLVVFVVAAWVEWVVLRQSAAIPCHIHICHVTNIIASTAAAAAACLAAG